MANITSYGFGLDVKKMDVGVLDGIEYAKMTDANEGKLNKKRVKDDAVTLAQWMVNTFERQFFAASGSECDKMNFSTLNLNTFGTSGSRGVLDFALVAWFERAQKKSVLPFFVNFCVHENTGSWLFTFEASPVMHRRRDYERSQRKEGTNE